MYRSIKFDFCLENYFSYINNINILTKLRSGTLKLNVEVGRFSDIPREMRLCVCCNMQCVENEFHFVLVCPAYRAIRILFLPRYYCSWPTIFKLSCLLKANSRSLTIKLCNYLKSAWKARSDIIG